MFLEHKALYDMEEDVPDDPYTIPFGEANYVLEGDDVTVVALSRMVQTAKSAASGLAKDGIEIELIDPRNHLALR